LRKRVFPELEEEMVRRRCRLELITCAWGGDRDAVTEEAR